MSGFRRSIAAFAIAVFMSGCTLVGLGLGAGVASSRNANPAVQQGYKPRTSVGGAMALGGVIGLAVDIGIFALSLNSGQFGGH